MIAAATIGGAALGAFLGPYAAKPGKKVISAVKTAGKKVACKVTKKGCFVAGTVVLTEDGNIPIEEVEEGNYVYAENPETGEKGLKRVLLTFINESDKLIHIHVSKEEIVATPQHPFYVCNKGWVGAVELLSQLNEVGTGWKKVYQNGWINGQKVSLHYFKDASGKIFDFKIKYGRWS